MVFGFGRTFVTGEPLRNRSSPGSGRLGPSQIFAREIFVLVSASVCASQPHRNGRQIEDSAMLPRTGAPATENCTFPFAKVQVQLRNLKKSENGGRYRIRTYDFHRVKMALYR